MNEKTERMKGLEEPFLTGSQYELVKSLDRKKMDNFCWNLFAEGYAHGVAAGIGDGIDAIMDAIIGTKGIGDVAAVRIRRTLERIFGKEEEK